MQEWALPGAKYHQTISEFRKQARLICYFGVKVWLYNQQYPERAISDSLKQMLNFHIVSHVLVFLF